jgi:hypothetical protein
MEDLKAEFLSRGQHPKQREGEKHTEEEPWATPKLGHPGTLKEEVFFLGGGQGLGLGCYQIPVSVTAEQGDEGTERLGEHLFIHLFNSHSSSTHFVPGPGAQ